MLELFNQLPKGRRLKKGETRIYHQLVKAFRDETGKKLSSCTCSLKVNLRLIEDYLKRTGQL